MVCVYGPVPALLNTTFLYEWHDQLLREDNPKAGAVAPEKIAIFAKLATLFKVLIFRLFAQCYKF